MIILDEIKARGFGSKIKEIRLEKHFSLRQVAQQSKIDGQPVISPSYWSLIERGERNIPKVDTLKRMAKGLRISENEILNLAGLSKIPINTAPYDDSLMVDVPIVGTIKAGPNGYAMADYDGSMPALGTKLNNDHEHIWLKVNGNSMSGDGIRDGDLALIELSDDFEDPNAIYAVVYDSELATLKRIQKTDSSIILLPSNPEIRPIVIDGHDADTFRIVGKLKQSMRTY